MRVPLASSGRTVGEVAGRPVVIKPCPRPRRLLSRGLVGVDVGICACSARGFSVALPVCVCVGGCVYARAHASLRLPAGVVQGVTRRRMRHRGV